MPDSEQSHSARDFLKEAGQSVCDGGLGPVNDAVELVYGPNQLKSGACLAASAALAIVFPFPFFVAGILAVANAAANGVKKRYGPPVADPAPAPAG
jgi:hypothetical protein